VERRAYKQALYAVRDDHQALDYRAGRDVEARREIRRSPAAELPLVFPAHPAEHHTGFLPRQKVAALWTTPISSLFGPDAENDADPLETLEVPG